MRLLENASGDAYCSYILVEFNVAIAHLALVSPETD